jgi:hypothetical protein
VLAGELAGTAWHAAAGALGRLSLAAGALILLSVMLVRPKRDRARAEPNR